jgi:hypothetical protein
MAVSATVVPSDRQCGLATEIADLGILLAFMCYQEVVGKAPEAVARRPA